ncbi:hypothetical protein PVX_081290 [Plasmodium vivax]|uniref:Uncharacterized protein n=1 Tax=Plasmodium vivax (strain Salvador I) TaxID=126793 RepID=A5K9R8_PLAVS|nr:hypothetical protein PVX_081290 [Plasmodium vivax]EDL43806.1 hypothetical protein PVX_081290 [Plasmodium vivax]|eukprot:XP_001613533.1 hypothetical protein [Plasmodium vivax Sal-1]
MKLLRRGLLLLLCGSACLSLLARTRAVAYDLATLGSAEKRLALNLLQVFEEARGAERGFYERLDNSQRIFAQVGGCANGGDGGDSSGGSDRRGGGSDRRAAGGDAPASFLQVKSKGPVEEETIWRALYDTQLRRSPPNEQVHVYSLENVGKEFEHAQMEALVSQAVILKNQFEANLSYMQEELSRGRKVREAVSEALALEDRVAQAGVARGSFQNGALRGGAAGRGGSGVRVLC